MTIKDLENDVRFREVPKGKLDHGDRVFYIRPMARKPVNGKPAHFCHIVFEVFNPILSLPKWDGGIAAHCQMTDHNGNTFNLDLLHADTMQIGEVILWYRHAHEVLNAVNYSEET